MESYAPAALPDLANAQSLGVTSFGISTVSNYIGTVVITSDASGRKGRSITNALGQLVRVDEPTAIGGSADADLGAIGSPAQPTYYKYDPYGNMVQVTQGVQNRYFKYDSLGRLIRVNQPEQEYHSGLDLPDTYNLSGHWTAAFDYDDLGNLVTAIDAKGVTTVNSYDRAGRVTTRAYYGEPDPGAKTPAVYFFYDGKGLGGEQSPNYAKGKLTKVSSSVSETRYKLFDNFGRLKEMEQRTPATDTETIAQATPRGFQIYLQPLGRAGRRGISIGKGDKKQFRDRWRTQRGQQPGLQRGLQELRQRIQLHGQRRHQQDDAWQRPVGNSAVQCETAGYATRAWHFSGEYEFVEK